MEKNYREIEELELKYLSLVLDEGGTRLHKTKVQEKHFKIDTHKVVFGFIKDYFKEKYRTPDRAMVFKQFNIMLRDHEEHFDDIEEVLFSSYFHDLSIAEIQKLGSSLISKQHPDFLKDVGDFYNKINSEFVGKSEVEDLFDTSKNELVVGQYLDRETGKMGIITPWPTLNEATYGWQGGDFVLIGARTGSGKCVDGETKMFDADSGLLVPIKDLVRDRSKTLAYLMGRGIKKYLPDAFIKSGTKETKRVTLDNGLEIIVTPEHPFLGISHQEVKCEDGTLCVGAYIASAKSVPFPDCEKEISELVLNRNALRTAEGCISGNKTINGISNFVFRLDCTQLQKWLFTFFAGCGNVIGPNFIYIIIHSKEVLLEIRHLLLRFSIYSKIKKMDDGYKLLIEDHHEKLFWEKIKNGTLNRILPKESPFQIYAKDIEWAKVVAIEDAGIREVYDLTIDDGNWFVANDIIVHNTFFVLHMVNKAIQQDKKVFFISPEMNRISIVNRFASIALKISYNAIRKGELTSSQKKRFFEFVMALDQSVKRDRLMIFSDRFGEMTVEKLRNAVIREKPDIIFVDGIYLIKDKKEKDKMRAAPIIADDMKIMAKEFNIPIICTTQLNRAATNLKLADITLANVSLSEAFAWNADHVFALGKADDTPDQMVIKTLKIREGEFCKDIYMNWNFRLHDFSEFSPQLAKRPNKSDDQETNGFITEKDMPF